MAGRLNRSQFVSQSTEPAPCIDHLQIPWYLTAIRLLWTQKNAKQVTNSLNKFQSYVKREDWLFKWFFRLVMICYRSKRIFSEKNKNVTYIIYIFFYYLAIYYLTLSTSKRLRILIFKFLRVKTRSATVL